MTKIWIAKNDITCVKTDAFVYVANTGLVLRNCYGITCHFDSFFFPFSSLKYKTIAKAMLEYFALTMKKINSSFTSTYFITIPKWRDRWGNMASWRTRREKINVS